MPASSSTLLLPSCTTVGAPADELVVRSWLLHSYGSDSFSCCSERQTRCCVAFPLASLAAFVVAHTAIRKARPSSTLLVLTFAALQLLLQPYHVERQL